MIPRQDAKPRIVSLLPSLTEIVCKLGFAGQLVGRSHECDYPPQVTELPVCTKPKYPATGAEKSSEINKSVLNLINQGLSVYHVFEDRLQKIAPDIILSQDHCKVCAVSLDEVEKAVQSHLAKSTRVISVSPINLKEIFASFQSIANALNVSEKGKWLTETATSHLNEIKNRVVHKNKPRVVAIEWIDPLMTGGNWMPELIEIAGGENLLSEAGKHSPWIDLNVIREADPDILLILPCGYRMEKTLSEMGALSRLRGWNQMRAVRNNRVYVLDGHHYFNRPGPRITDSASILAEVFHPGLFAPEHHKMRWIQFKSC